MATTIPAACFTIHHNNPHANHHPARYPPARFTLRPFTPRQDLRSIIRTCTSWSPAPFTPLALSVNGGGLTHSLSLDGYYCAGHKVKLTVWHQVWRCCVMNMPLLSWSSDGEAVKKA